MTRDDVDLLMQLKEGDSRAFAGIVDRFERRLIGYFFTMSGNRQTAEDCAQEVFLRLYRARASYSPDASAATFVFRIARNYWIDVYRSRKARPGESPLEPGGDDDGEPREPGHPDAGPRPDDSAVRGEDEARLREARLTLERRRQLVKDKVISRAELDTAEAEVASLEARIALAREQIEVARSQVNARRTDLDDMVDAAALGLKSLGRAVDFIGPYQATGAFVMRGWAKGNADALERYLASPARARFWRELEPMNDVHRAERFWGPVDFALEALEEGGRDSGLLLSLGALVKHQDDLDVARERLPACLDVRTRRGLAERDGRRPVYVLTSARTFSAGEGFAFLLQERGRAEVIGERTPGAANPGRPYPVNALFEVTVPNGKVVSAVRRGNWEGIGVVPDIEVPAAEALRIAHARALERLNHLECGSHAAALLSPKPCFGRAVGLTSPRAWLAALKAAAWLPHSKSYSVISFASASTNPMAQPESSSRRRISRFSAGSAHT